MSTKRAFRCGVYTRKSTEEGLDQAFNSLDAQRDACVAYIKSQAGEGWKALPTHYDDGGFTGANMDRPALQRLLGDIDRGLVDVVVVYKIDRLTRSLADFAKIVERFDARGVSFVSITQSFNTTTSMGRLTLNVLLSFAQFEREVTAERIRDKIAASRAKGMWMGGGVPLGYDVRDRKLIINKPDADTVRFIFRRFLELGSVGDLRAQLDRKGITTKRRVSRNGRKSGGGRWYVGPLHHLLRNRVYIGEAVHKGTSHPGEHEPIVPKALFARVQAKLDAASRSWKKKRTIEASGLLTGVIKDDRGNVMTPQWSLGQGGKRHFYYVSQALLQRRREEGGSLPRVSASAIEGAVLDCWHALMGQDTRSASAVARVGTGDDLKAHAHQSDLRPALRLVTVAEDCIKIEFDRALATVSEGGQRPKSASMSLRTIPGCKIERTPTAIVVTVPQTLRRRSGTKRVEDWGKGDWSGAVQRHDPRLIRALVHAHTLRAKIETGENSKIEELASRDGTNRNDARSLLRLSFLAPDIQQAILDGRQPIGLSFKSITQLDLPASWSQQRRLLGVSAKIEKLSWDV